MFKPPPSFSFSSDSINLANDWRRWEQLFRTCPAAAELKEKSDATQMAILPRRAAQKLKTYLLLPRSLRRQ